jgi:hypothetical protein
MVCGDGLEDRTRGHPGNRCRSGKGLFVDQVGFNADHEYQISENLRFVQLTPPRSACSILLGTGITQMPPGSRKVRRSWSRTPRPAGGNSSTAACSPARSTALRFPLWH